MLSLKSSNTSSSTKFRKKKFTSVKSNLVLWIDFTDRRTVYSDSSGTLINNNQGIEMVENKAYNERFNRKSNLSLGTQFIMTGSSNKPGWKSPEVAGGLGYANFDGSTDRLTATKSAGNVDTNILSNTRINTNACTVFWVIKQTSATPGERYFLNWWASDGGGGADPVAFGTNVPNKTSVWMSDASDKAGAVTLVGAQPTTNIELWTAKLAGTGASYLYRDGDTSDGTTTGNSKSHEYNFSTNSSDNAIHIGYGGGGQYFNGRVYEILVYSEALPDKEIKEIERRLKQKYNL